MSAGLLHKRSAGKGGRTQSLFYRDLSASSATRASDVGTPHQAGAAMWRENVERLDPSRRLHPPPPPIYTLEDRMGSSPEATSDFAFHSPNLRPEEKHVSSDRTVHSPPSERGVYGTDHWNEGSPTTPPPAVSKTRSWLLPWDDGGLDSSRESGYRERSSPASGVVQQQSSGLLTLSAPREIIRPEYDRIYKGIEGEEWVTVFGFGVEETNAVMREFEKCGPIVNHISGPGGANWVHIQYQTCYDAQKALQKNGVQVNGALIVGVKPLDPLQRQALVEKVNLGGTPPLALPLRNPVKGVGQTAVQASTWSHYRQPMGAEGPTGAPRSVAALASPSKSTLSRLVDLLFGI